MELTFLALFRFEKPGVLVTYIEPQFLFHLDWFSVHTNRDKVTELFNKTLTDYHAKILFNDQQERYKMVLNTPNGELEIHEGGHLLFDSNEQLTVVSGPGSKLLIESLIKTRL